MIHSILQSHVFTQFFSYFLSVLSLHAYSSHPPVTSTQYSSYFHPILQLLPPNTPVTSTQYSSYFHPTLQLLLSHPPVTSTQYSSYFHPTLQLFSSHPPVTSTQHSSYFHSILQLLPPNTPVTFIPSSSYMHSIYHLLCARTILHCICCNTPVCSFYTFNPIARPDEIFQCSQREGDCISNRCSSNQHSQQSGQD